MTSPAHTRSHSAASTSASSYGKPAVATACSSSGQNDAPRCVEVREQRGVGGRRVGSSAGAGEHEQSAPGRGTAAGPGRRWRRAPPAPTHTTSPDGAQRVEVGRLGSRRPAPAARRSRAPTPASAAPWSMPERLDQRRRRPAGASRRPATRGRKRASASPSTGSTSLRSAASDRRRSWRSTSSSHHSRSTPSGRNSPRTTRPSRFERLERGHAPASAATPKRRGDLRGEERTVGAGEAGDEVDAAGRSTGSVNAAGQAERERDAERVAQPGRVFGARRRAPRRRS